MFIHRTCPEIKFCQLLTLFSANLIQLESWARGCLLYWIVLYHYISCGTFIFLYLLEVILSSIEWSTDDWVINTENHTDIFNQQVYPFVLRFCNKAWLFLHWQRQVKDIRLYVFSAITITHGQKFTFVFRKRLTAEAHQKLVNECEIRGWPWSQLEVKKLWEIVGRYVWSDQRTCPEIPTVQSHRSIAHQDSQCGMWPWVKRRRR